jgi:hypothetical protein
MGGKSFRIGSSRLFEGFYLSEIKNLDSLILLKQKDIIMFCLNAL